MQEIESARARLATLAAVSAQLGEDLPWPDLLQRVMEASIQLSGAERGCLVSRPPATRQWELGAAYPMTWSPLEETTGAIDQALLEQAATAGAPLLMTATHSGVDSQRLASLWIPLRLRDQTCEVIYLDKPLTQGAFSQFDVDVLLICAHQAAVALNNARLSAQSAPALARRVEELTLFQQIDRQLNQSLELAGVLEQTLDWALRLAHAQTGAVGLLHDDEQGRPVVQMTAQRAGRPHPTPRLDMQHPLLARLAHGRRPVQASADLSGPSVQLATPIWREGILSGFIWLERYQPEAFTAEDIILLERLADRAAGAIEKARLYQAAQATHQAQTGFVSMVLHEMRNPIMILRGYSELLTLGTAGELTQEQSALIQTMARQVDKLELLLRDWSELAQLEAGGESLTLAPVDLAELIRECAALWRDACQRRRQGLVVATPPDLPPVYADRSRTAQILTNLLSNAHKYTPEGGMITLRAAPTARQVEVMVSDTGIGIARADQTQLFTRFFRAEHAWVQQQPGWGLGLTIVKRLVQAQGGAIRVHSTPGQGSMFVFTLPRLPSEMREDGC